MGSVYTEAQKQEIKNAVTPLMVAEALGLETKRMGRNISILCLWHQDKHHGSCFLRKNGCKCFSCGKSADIFEMVEAARNVNFKEAATIICDMFNIAIATEKKSKKPQIQFLSSEELALIGIKDKPNEVNRYSVERIINITDESFSEELLEPGQRLEWHPFTDADKDKDVYREMSKTYYHPTGYYLIKETIIRNPLRFLAETDPKSYKALIFRKAIEALENMRHFEDELLNMIDKASLGSIQRTNLMLMIESIKKRKQRCKNIAAKYGPKSIEKIPTKEFLAKI